MVTSYRDAIGFRQYDEPRSLRRPQIGALHSIIGYWSSGIELPGIVVMPTGTGKTETMIAVLVARQLERVLVIVPTVTLRDQVAGRFETLGILQKEQIVTPAAGRPVVGRIAHRFNSPDTARQFAGLCNVLVATPAALNQCSDDVREALFNECTHLMVDEAHHSAARTWATVIDAFAHKPVLLFTATPFREDRRALPGRIIYRFPLREAQGDGYFAKIDYQAVLAIEGTDDKIAELATERLRKDIAEGKDHVLMARAATVAAADRLLPLYQAHGPEFSPTLIHDQLSARRRRAALDGLQSRSSRIIICVDMLGEGFDLPALKVGAIHDVRRSLSPMIQLVGRFTRTSVDDTIGTASVFVAKDPSTALSPLRDLLREDADWNHLLRDITDRVTEAAERVSEFESSFSDAPEDVPVSLLQPKMSAIAYRTPNDEWNPDAARSIFAEGTLVDNRIAVGAHGSVAWFVVAHEVDVPWGHVPGLDQLTYELIMMRFDRDRRILYVHGSTRGDYKVLARTVCGTDTRPINGSAALRVLDGVARLIPSNVGLLDVRDRFRRFTLHVGSDVNEALNAPDSAGRSQTHIATSGFEGGERVTICAAVSGRIWSIRTANNVQDWVNWCDAQGTKLLDASIDPQRLFANLIIPTEVDARPTHVLLGLEWPWQIYLTAGGGRLVSMDGSEYVMTDVDIEVDDHGTVGPFLFSFVTAAWRIPYRADVTSDGIIYSPLDRDATVSSLRTDISLAEWLNANKLTFFLDGDRLIESDRLHQPRQDVPPYDRKRFIRPSWDGVNPRVESQTAERRQDSIQAYMSAYLREQEEFNVLLDDDGRGEAADLVGLRISEGNLIVTLVHCKYSSEDTAGARLDDLYEVCGQAVRSAKWRLHGTQPLLRHIARRAGRYYERTGATPFEAGDIDELHRIQELAPQLSPEFHVMIAQPGLSAAACNEEHLRLIAGADSYVRAVTRGSFTIVCSD